MFGNLPVEPFEEDEAVEVNVAKHTLVWFIPLLAPLWLGTVAVAEPVALVVEKSGASTPEVAPYTEILAPLKIALPAESKLVFYHYPTCHTVELVGGFVQFSKKEYKILEGAKDLLTEGPCPTKVWCSEGAGCETAGIVLRSIQPNPSKKSRLPLDSMHLPPHPTFMLVGKRGGDFKSVQISNGDQVLLDSPLHGQQFQWPEEKDLLLEQTEYELAFIPKSTIIDSFPITLTVTITTNSGIQDEVVLLRVD